jgi:hypothetical protein
VKQKRKIERQRCRIKDRKTYSERLESQKELGVEKCWEVKQTKRQGKRMKEK